MATSPNKDKWSTTAAGNAEGDRFPTDLTVSQLTERIRELAASLANLGDATLGKIEAEQEGF